MYVPGSLKSFIDLLESCYFAAMYEQALSAAGEGIDDYWYFHSEKGMS